jgi:hypothetical protein
MIRDEDLRPTGIPVQISKNWHRNKTDRFEGPWYRGYTMMTIPAGKTVNFEYTRASGFWGGLPGASQAQLALVGWGKNQQWDQLAMGCWGESITFDPDVCLRRSMIDDVRPLMDTNMSDVALGLKWGWTNNVGGGDFLLYHNPAGQKQWNGRMRTHYKQDGPNLTEMIYGGQSQDKKIEMKVISKLVRSDDYVRIIYHLRYDVNSEVRFSRLAFFQLGADRYNNHIYGKMARGNSNGMIEEWAPKRGGKTYSRRGVPCAGESPWFSLHEGVKNRQARKHGGWANRGMIIRSWNATLGGNSAPIPHASVYGTKDGGYDSANVELTVPPGIKKLLPGDFVECVVEQVTLPQFASDYYGPNSNLKRALLAGENSWQLVNREASFNTPIVAATVGAAGGQWPIVIKPTSSGHAEFSVRGGLAYYPVTFSGISHYTKPVFQEQVNGTWRSIDQSVHGDDFWQTKYHSASNTWSLTYNLNLDTVNDAEATKSYRFFHWSLKDANWPLFSYAGEYKEVVLPQNTTVLSGETNRVPQQVLWEVSSGDANKVRITNPTALVTTVEFASAGVYEFTLSLIDKGRQKLADNVIVRVLNPGPPSSGMTHWFDASKISGASAGDAIIQWTDQSGNDHHTSVPVGNAAPLYVRDAGTGRGLSSLKFTKHNGPEDSGAFQFPGTTNIRAAFFVFKGSGFLLTDNQRYDFHAGSPNDPAAPLFSDQWSNVNIRNGSTYVNGVLVNPTTDAMPVNLNNGFNVISLVTVGPVTADSLNKDRTYNASNQEHAEIIIYDRVLSDVERRNVESYLQLKWFSDTAPRTQDLR